MPDKRSFYENGIKLLQAQLDAIQQKPNADSALATANILMAMSAFYDRLNALGEVK